MISNYVDDIVEKMWNEFLQVPLNEISKGVYVLKNNWKYWKEGTNRETIWNWFDRHYSKGVVWLMYQV